MKTILFCLIILASLNTLTDAQQWAFKYPHTTHKKQKREVMPEEEKPAPYTLYKASHQNAAELKQQIELLFPLLKIQANPATQTVLLYGPKKMQTAAKDLLKEIDITAQQVLFEVEIIEIAHADLEQYSSVFAQLLSGFPIELNLEKQLIVLPSSLEGALSGLIQTGQAKVIAKPLIKTTENNRAYVRVGDQLPFLTSISDGQIKISNFQQINTGIYVEVLPKIITTSNALTELQIEISSIKLWKEINNIQFPIIATRKTETTVVLSTESPLIIAGLMQEDSNQNQSEVPFISKIPLLGKLFQTQKKESSLTDVIIKVRLLMRGNPNETIEKER